MNTANLKKIAPRARTAFITAIKARAAEFGITAKGHIEPVISGEVLQVAGFTHPASCASALKRLQQRLAKDSYETLMEHVSYTWFNRFCAIRFMELKSEEGYLEHGVRLLSHPSQPQGFEVLDRAPEVIDSLITEGVSLDKPALLDLLLAGNEQETLFRELLLGQCHRLHQTMPFLFEAIDDETELLLPTGLTRTDAFWRELVDKIPEPDWQQVEVIGWLYQFYISDEKERVDKKVKAGKSVDSSEIPAKTQLFTPNWIVQYLVQNSVGRHWLQTYPDSTIKSTMQYYIEPGKQASEVVAQLAKLTPTSIEPESIHVLDPACGSGHILVEAYNLLYRIYEERGYRSREIPELILKNNLFGLDIDDRAAQLAGFALIMRARQDDRRLFSRNNGRGIDLNIYSLQESRHLNISKLWQALNLNAAAQHGQTQDLLTITQVDDDPRLTLLKDLHQLFLNAKTLGSLISVPTEKVTAIEELYTTILELSKSGDSMQRPESKKLLPLLAQARLLAKRYDAVIANPPYMGSKGMNADLKEFAKKQFPDSKSDLFAMFMESGFNLLKMNGFHAMVTMQSWMFLSSYENLRLKILNHSSIECMAHMANMVMGIAFGTAATVCRNHGHMLTRGAFCYVENEDIGSDGRPTQFPPLNERNLKASKQSGNE
nr:BREX-1 system adenine-specific DNA-methyltransferase PglX [Citrobacter freundii]EHL6952503.1 BREX-1 system adenine-specific DNA-methyltransferase PglX [Citrobacter freundii]